MLALSMDLGLNILTLDNAYQAVSLVSYRFISIQHLHTIEIFL